MGDIGVPDSYEVWIRDSQTQETVRAVPFAQLEWQRIRCDVSSASVTVPRTTLALGESHFYPTPWRHAMVVYRNGYQVWSGPVIGWRRSSEGDLTIMAKDGAVNMQKQFVGQSRNFVDEEVSQVAALIFADARLGEAGYAPYPMTIGAFYPLSFYPHSSSTDPGPAGDVRYIDAVTTLQLDYASFQRVWDVASDLAQQDLLYFCCVNDYLYVNEVGVRQQLAVGDAGWPMLTDDNVVDLPQVNLDGTDTATAEVRMLEPFEIPTLGGDHDHAITYINGTSDAVYTGFATYGTFDFVNGIYIYPPHRNYPPGADPGDYMGALALQVALPKGLTRSSSQLVSDPYEERVTWGKVGGMAVTVEQIELATTFSHPSLADDLHNLIPGCRFTIGFSDRSMFDVPIAERKLGVFPNSWRYDIAGLNNQPLEANLPWTHYADPNVLSDATQTFDWSLRSLWASRVDHLSLRQLDVSVSASNGAFSEQVKLSLVPTIQYVLKGYTGAEPSIVATYVPVGPVVVPMPVRPRFVG